MADYKNINIRNKRATFDYEILEEFIAGVVLVGTEIKSIRLGKVNIADAYASVDNGEVYVKGMNISPYEQGNIFNRDPMREKKLLMHKKEILKLGQYVTRDSYTLVPLSLYFSGSKVKLELGLCRGKKNYDKRDSIAERDSKRRMERAFKELNQ